MKWTIEYLRENGLIAYEYIRGSHAYGLNVATSDEDHGGVFIAPPEMIMGLRGQYVEQVADEKNDVVFYEFGRWIELILKANPTALESLFIPKDCIIGEVHPAVQYILNHRDAFVSKECFNTFYGYAVSQIGKARGLNKKIVNPVEERKGILDFCYTFKHQGSEPIADWLAARGLKQEYCGLVNVPNMKDVYAVFYDWGNHILHEFGGDCRAAADSGLFADTCEAYCDEDGMSWSTKGLMEGFKPIGYRGIIKRSWEVPTPEEEKWDAIILEWKKNSQKVMGLSHEEYERLMEYKEKKERESNSVRLSSIPDKNERPICHIYYNKDAYTCHCRDYHDYQEWKKNRNEVRYEGNLGHNYDSKNIMHCMRLIRMAKELAQGKGFNVRRTEDRDYLLSIRNHKFEYEDIMAQVEEEKAEMEEAIKTCTLPDKVDLDRVNEILIDARKKYVFSEMKINLTQYLEEMDRI